VLVLVRHGGRGKRSGVEIGKQGSILFELRGQKVARLVAYLDRSQTFADLYIGLRCLRRRADGFRLLSSAVRSFARDAE
jgi:hypothetical protein